ncbi:MAG TPA: hypothetical protein VGS19_00455 [Streptosporangiaceae bacterium]|nr:hypothetical protein [Streptosporangiaceae bacterium]
MITDELENELRSVFARSAESIIVPQQARQRLLQRDYHPRTGNRRLAASVAAAATATAVTGLVVVSLIVTSPSGPLPVQQPELPSAASVGKAMLTAFHQVSIAGDIVYVRQAAMPRGRVLMESQNWIWPLQPAPGQQVRERFVYSQRIPASAKALTVLQDAGVVYRFPRDSGGPLIAKARQTQVCYPQYQRTEANGADGCEFLSEQTRAGVWTTPQTRPGTWSRVSFRAAVGSDFSPGAGLSPATIAHDIITGQWEVVRRARLDGQPALELQHDSQALPIAPLWVNARTHLPIRNGGEDYAYLPPTTANLALLRVPIPRGLPRSNPHTG